MPSLDMVWWGLAAAAALLFAAWRVLSVETVTRVKPAAQYPGWQLIYSDKRGKPMRGVDYGTLLRADVYGLTGKPDMIYRKRIGRGLMPVELKSGAIRGAGMPHEGDLLQLAAYFLIMEEAYGIRPKQGRIVYADGAFRVRNTRRLRAEVLRTLARMRRMFDAGIDAEQPNSAYASCRYCMCKQTVCEQSYFGPAES